MMVWNLFPELGHYCSTKDMRDQSRVLESMLTYSICFVHIHMHDIYFTTTTSVSTHLAVIFKLPFTQTLLILR